MPQAAAPALARGARLGNWVNSDSQSVSCKTAWLGFNQCDPGPIQQEKEHKVKGDRSTFNTCGWLNPDVEGLEQTCLFGGPAFHTAGERAPPQSRRLDARSGA